MRYSTAVIAACMLLVFSVPAVRTANAGGEDIAALAANLGPENFKDSFEVMKTLPIGSVRALIGELRVVDSTHISGYLQEQDRKDMHVIWCIRMLRALTGLDFTAKTQQAFGPDEEQRMQCLTKKETQGIPFFATVMSSDSVYVAPPDAQSDIIWQWSNWYNNYGMTHEYNRELPPEEKWYD